MENIMAESVSPVDSSGAMPDSLRERIKGMEKDIEWVKRLQFVMIAGVLALIVMVNELRGTVEAIQNSILN